MRELQRISPALWGLAETALANGDAEKAADLVVAAWTPEAVADAAYLYPYLVTGVRAHLELGDPGGARGVLDRAAPLIRRRGVPGTLPAVDHAEGLLALAEDRPARPAPRSPPPLTPGPPAVACGKAPRHSSISHEPGTAQTSATRHPRRRSRPEAGRRPPGAGARGARDGAPGDHWRGGERDPWAPLTAREFQIARLVTEGRTNVEIAEELGIARKTVSAHLEHIFAKLGIGRRAEIAAWTASRPVLHSRPHGNDREE